MQNPDGESSAGHDRLLALAFHTEKVASRRLARQRGCSQEMALVMTLEAVAGATGLSQLLDERGAQRAMLANKLAAGRQRKEDARIARQLLSQAPAHAWQAWFDGSALPNPGRCGIGALLIGPDGRRFEISQDGGYGDSSEAEYRALIAVLELALPLQPALLLVYGDSQVVINDVINDVNIDMKNEADRVQQRSATRLQSYRHEVKILLQQLPNVQLRWIPRHKNGAADALSQHASHFIAAEFIPETQ
jgi:ribonuclease HI